MYIFLVLRNIYILQSEFYSLKVSHKEYLVFLLFEGESCFVALFGLIIFCVSQSSLELIATFLLGFSITDITGMYNYVWLVFVIFN